MNGIITCSVKDAKKYMDHLNDNDIVILTIMDKNTHIHSKPEKIEKRDSNELIEKAESIEYQNNDIFGRVSLYGVTKEKTVIHNLLFPQLE